MGRHTTRSQVVTLVALLASACTSKDIAETNGDGDPGDGDGDPGDGDPGDGDPGDGDPGDGDGDPDDGNDMPSCQEIDVHPSYTAPEVMFMVDASGTMFTDTWDHDSDAMTPPVTRWSSVHAVTEASTMQFDAALVAGIQRFPSQDACPNATQQASNCYDADACVTAAVPEATLALGNSAAMLAAIPGPDADNTEIVGATPTGRAFDSVLEHLLARPSGGQRYILLITDGAANCNDALAFPDLLELYDETVLAKVESAYLDDGITTVVFGVDIANELLGIGPDGEAEANPHARLDELALAGGAPKDMRQGPDMFYNAGDEGQLLDAVTGVLDELASCTVDLSLLEQGAPHPTAVPFVSFDIGGVVVPTLEPQDCEAGDGWMWIEYGMTLKFCGASCEQFRAGVAVEGSYGCPPPA
jgi:hypothetical protein